MLTSLQSWKYIRRQLKNLIKVFFAPDAVQVFKGKKVRKKDRNYRLIETRGLTDQEFVLVNERGGLLAVFRACCV